MKLIDLTNQRFGKLVVLQRDITKKGTYWICKCDCGNVIVARKDQLTRANYPKRSCGCDFQKKILDATSIDEIGNRYGKLTVIERYNTNKPGTYWKCKCDCGNETVVSGVHLRNGSTKSCGCLRYESKNGIDETGNIYGDLTVLYRSEKTNGSHIFWHCKCKCGNECDIDGTHLRSGAAKNCGCKKSAGEDLIKQLLEENHIQFEREKTFPDLFGVNGGKLRFDFAITDNAKNVKYLIEYDGIQHFDKKCFGQSDEDFAILKRHDALKNEYCLKHNIPLLRIRYTQLNCLKIDDLLLKEGDYSNDK